MTKTKIALIAAGAGAVYWFVIRPKLALRDTAKALGGAAEKTVDALAEGLGGGLSAAFGGIFSGAKTGAGTSTSNVATEDMRLPVGKDVKGVTVATKTSSRIGAPLKADASQPVVRNATKGLR